MLLLPNSPTTFQFVRIEFLEVCLGDLVERDLTELWDDVFVDRSLVSCLGGFSHRRFHIVAVPEVDPLTKGHIFLQSLQRNEVFFPNGFHFFNHFAPGFGCCGFDLRVTIIIIAYNDSALVPSV